MNRSEQSIRNYSTPWGDADSVTHYAEGVAFYSTPSHGGFKLSDERLAALTAKLGPVKTFCGQPQWFEEDCDWAHVAIAFPELFTADELKAARATRAYWDKCNPAVAT